MTSSTSGLFRRSSAKSLDSSTDPSADQPMGTAGTLGYGPGAGAGAGPTAASRAKTKECFVFEPQQWRKTVCKNCFRTQPEHKPSGGKSNEATASTAAAPSGPAVMLRRPDNGTHLSPSDLSTGGGGAQDIKPSGRGLGNLTSCANRAAARKFAAGQRNLEEGRAQTPALPDSRRSSLGSSGISSTVATTAPGIHSSASSIDARYIEELENDFFALEDKHETVLRERDQLATELEAKIRTVGELQTTLDQYREKVTALERRCAHMDEEIKGYRERLRLPESDQSPTPSENPVRDNRTGSPSAAAGDGGPASSELQQRLNEVEQLCQEVMEENEQLKEEVEEMQREIEEMHDHFQEDDRDAMRELQRDLEAANKTCRILQFKLRKTERRFEQCEAERAHLEERLARLEAELYSEADVAHIRNLEEEVRIAKEVGVRLNNELDILDEKRAFFEEESKQLKDELQASQAGRIAAENELGRLRLEVDRIKLEKGILDRGPLQVTDKNRSRQVSGGRPSLSRETSFEEQQLQRELEASRERETDLSEQLRYADEENRKLKRRMKESQVENDLLSKKLDRLMATQAREAFQYGQMAKTQQQQQQQQQPSAGHRNLDAQLEDELSATRHQLNVAEEENSNLRKKVLGYERSHIPNLEEMARMGNRTPRATHPDAPELDQLRNQLNLIQDHLARIEQERERLEGENRRLRHGPAGSLTEDSLAQENSNLREQLKDWAKRLRQIIRELNLVGSVGRDNEWMEKYNEAREIIKEQELQLSRTKRRVAELQDENANLRAIDRKTEQRQRRGKEKSSASFTQMSNEALMQEVKSLEEELDEVTSDLTVAREQACTAQLRVTYLEDCNSELRGDAERRESELLTYIGVVDGKNRVLTQILSLLQEQSEAVQNEFARNSGAAQSDECMRVSTDSQLGASLSVGSDEADMRNKTLAQNEGTLQKLVHLLEQQLIEERKRVELVEDQLDCVNKQGTGVSTNFEIQARMKQIDLLKKELEEKDELIEAKDEQLADLKSRIEQSRRMNDALRTLMEKDTESERQPNVPRSDLNVEVASYRKELESSRKEMQILRNNLAQAEKIRERLVKDNRELQEEVKLREDSIFEQDDEIEKRNAELRAVKMTMESLQKELDQTRQDLSEAKARESSGSSGRLSAQIVQNERIRAELHETTRELNEIRLKYEDTKRMLSTTEDKCGQLTADVTQLRNSLQEKDSMIIDLNKNLQQSKDDMGQCKLDSQAARIEKIDLEKQLETVMTKLTTKEKECAQMQLRLQEVSAAPRENDRVGSSHDSGIGTPEASRNRDGTLSRRSAEVDRLRRELAIMRSEREELLTEIKRLRSKLEKRLQAEQFGHKAGENELIGLPKGNAYTKALAAQHSTTKITLLNEHIAYLNKVTAELKVQNESLQNHVIDYQRRYRSLKEQYEGEQEAWLTERVVLESKAKEQEDRKLTIANTRKLLQSTTAKLYEVEASAAEKYQKLEIAYEKLEAEKIGLESKLSQLEEHQKLPKVLQRFSATGTGARASVLATQSRPNTTDSSELTRRLDSAERTVAKLRAELAEARTANETAMRVALEEAENARHAAEQEAEDLRDRLLTMECYRQQAELFRHRQYETEESAEKEFKVWQEEREHLLYRAEEARVLLEQWFSQLQCRVSDDLEKSNELVEDVLKQMEKWRSSRGKVPCLKRRTGDSIYSNDSMAQSGSVPASPATTLWRAHPLASSALPPAGAFRPYTHRSTSMEWGNGRLYAMPTANYRESSLGAGAGSALRGSAMSLAVGTGVGGGSNYSLLMATRCGRSVSPEVTVRKLSNYPDPTPGFLVRPTSRQGSQDSLCNPADYTQRSFTLPGKPPIRSVVSPARKKFFEENLAPSPGEERLTLAPATQPADHNEPVPNQAATPSERPVCAITSDHTPSKKEDDTSLPASSTVTTKDEPTTHRSGSGLSIADRFVRWSSAGSQSSRKTPKREVPEKKTESPAPKASKKPEAEAKQKNRRRSPHAASETREVKPSPSDSTTASSAAQPAQSTNDSKAAQPPSAKSIKRSGSVSNISPAIMALRQKFSGGNK